MAVMCHLETRRRAAAIPGCGYPHPNTPDSTHCRGSRGLAQSWHPLKD